MKNHSPWRTDTSVLRRSRCLRLSFFPCSRSRTASGFRASLAVTMVLTGARSGTPATNQCRSSWPQRNFSLMSGWWGRSAARRTIKSRWRSLGCTSSTSTSAWSSAWMSKNSPCRSWPISMTTGPGAGRQRFRTRARMVALAPSFSNLVWMRLASMPGKTWVGVGRFGGCSGRQQTFRVNRRLPRGFLVQPSAPGLYQPPSEMPTTHRRREHGGHSVSHGPGDRLALDQGIVAQ